MARGIEWPISHAHISPACGPRRDGHTPDMLVLHYTACPTWRALDLLASPKARVSSHYLVPDAPAVIFQLVDESKRAWHAGVSSWRGESDVNSRSIGIEIVGWGYTYGPIPPLPPCPTLRRPVEVSIALARRVAERVRPWGVPVPPRIWAPFPAEQMQTVLELSGEIVHRWRISPEQVVGHSDVAPGRKVDPGPLFPWRMFAANGVGDWPREPQGPLTLAAPQGVSVPWMQQHLTEWGYGGVPQTGMLDAPTREVVAAFQMHFRPSCFDGNIDAESMRRLQLLLHQRTLRHSGEAAFGTALC